MPRTIHSIPVALCISALSAIAPALGADTPADPMDHLPAILKQLGSPDFNQRQAAQNDLSTVPLDQVDKLWALAKAELDPEIKARLTERVDQIVMEKLVHPDPISLDLVGENLAQVVNLLNARLGCEGLEASDPSVFKFKADNTPFWEIIRQLDKQTPLSISKGTTITSATFVPKLKLSPHTGIPIHDCNFYRAFATNLEVITNPGAKGISLALHVFNDPRIQTVKADPYLKVDQLTDQNGKNILQWVQPYDESKGVSQRPILDWTCTAEISTHERITRIGAIKASFRIAVLLAQKTTTMDITHLPAASTNTGRISFGVDNDATGTPQLHMKLSESPMDKPLPLLNDTIALSIHTIAGKSGGTLITAASAANPVVSLAPAFKGIRPTTLEITWTESSSPITIPVEFKNIEIPSGK